MRMGPPSPYFCIQCGHPAPQVYKTYANGNLVKLLPCKSCGELMDKYVEYDNIIIALNLILLNPMAYRHVLLNHAFEGFWKLGVVSLFVEAYCFWCSKKGVEHDDATDFYELEINFYTALLRTFFATVLFHAAVLGSCLLLPKTGGDENNVFGFGPRQTNSMKRGSNKRRSLPGNVSPSTSFPSSGNLQFSYLTVWKGLCLSGFAEMFKLVALIWSYANDYERIFLVECLFVLSNTQCYFVTTGISQVKSFFLIGTCYFLTKCVLRYYDQFITL
ncbi:protein ARV1 isoform X1 [Folsomia candida]|uniref:protein ARV1 isoform X1 n=1 Tax=Folsomia candida TaxID=158441 RepID=UPI000B8F11DD|nr:protein ARV1 isoform X1 [Folsomia candida]XP_035704083.1 protein ARV1 isoform X1 [Folsomia candida]